MRFLIVTLSLERAARIQQLLCQYQQLAVGTRIDWAKIHKVSRWFGEIKCRWAQGRRSFNLADYSCVIVDAYLPHDLQVRVCQIAQKRGVYYVTVTDPEALDWAHWSGQTGKLDDVLDTNELVAQPLNTNALADAAACSASLNCFAAAPGRHVYPPNVPPMVLTLPDHHVTGALANHHLPVPSTGNLEAPQQSDGAIKPGERYLVVDVPVSKDTPSDAGHYLVYWGEWYGWLHRVSAYNYQLHLRGALPETLTYEQIQFVLSSARLEPVSMAVQAP